MMLKSQVSNGRLRVCLLAFMMTSCPVLASAQDKLQSVDDFSTSTGKCGQSDLDKLKGLQKGFTYSVKPAEILSDSGIAPRSTVTVPPLTSFNCHGKSRDRDLWLVSRTDDPAYCGWVKSDTLLKTK